MQSTSVHKSTSGLGRSLLKQRRKDWRAKYILGTHVAVVLSRVALISHVP